MRAYVLVAALACSLVLAVASEMSWEEYKIEFDKHYKSPEEEAMRKALFLKSMARAEEHNAEVPPESSQWGPTMFSDWTEQERASLNGFSVSASERWANSTPSKRLLDLVDDRIFVPQFIDHRLMLNRVSPVKQQGFCNSCTSFAITGLLEGQQWKRAKIAKVVPLSEQQLLDCFSKSCSSISFGHALDYIIQAGGLQREKDYPYLSGATGTTFPCRFDPRLTYSTTRHIRGYERLPPGKEEVLKRVVANYGPVAIAIDASRLMEWKNPSAIYYEPTRCRNDLDSLGHAGLLVGYGSDPVYGDYWIVKNSWGRKWGDNGYFKLARNRGNHCGVATLAVIAHT